jgi:hypothetical protein
MVKVQFKRPFYGPVPGVANTSQQFLPVADLPQGNDGTYEFPDDYPLPSSAIIVSGQSTYVKPSADGSPKPTTQALPAARAASAKKSGQQTARY